MAIQSLSSTTTEFLNKSPFRLFIGGEWVEAASGETYASFSPSDRTQLAELALAGPEDVERAVAAARRAFEGPWGNMLPSDRATPLRRLGDLIAAHADELAELESVDKENPFAPLKLLTRRLLLGWPMILLAGQAGLPVIHRRSRCLSISSTLGASH